MKFRLRISLSKFGLCIFTDKHFCTLASRVRAGVQTEFRLFRDLRLCCFHVLSLMNFVNASLAGAIFGDEIS